MKKTNKTKTTKRPKRPKRLTLGELAKLIDAVRQDVHDDSVPVVASELDLECANDAPNRPVVDVHRVGHGADTEVWIVFDENQTA